MSKRKNWMLTIWGSDFPWCLVELPDVTVVRFQKEITRSDRLHWQAFAEFDKQVTKTSLVQYFQRHNRACHVGAREGIELRTVKQGIQYVSGYGPLALRKLVDPNERYFCREGQIFHEPVIGEFIQTWKDFHSKENTESDILYDINMDLSERCRNAYQNIWLKKMNNRSMA